ncbi:MAG: UMP kinase [bacterium]|nr:UMP kinase [bacterium]
MADANDRRKNGGVLVLSLGGSLLIPKEQGRPDADFIARFADLVIRERTRWRKIIIVCGGGAVARLYIDAARNVLERLGKLPPSDEKRWIDAQHWIGIHATRLNAQLVKVVFEMFRSLHPHAYRLVLKDPDRVPMQALTGRQRIVLAAGSNPGWSTDYVAVRLAEVFKAETVVNLTNVDRVYDRDPTLDGARALEEVSWEEYFRLFPRTEFRPGDNTPFDPVAAGYAADRKMRVIVLKGSNLHNLGKFLDGGPSFADKFRGTVIGGVARKRTTVV